jgi:hypothetical protein
MIANAEGRPKEKRATNVASLLSITKICAHFREQIGENKGFKAWRRQGGARSLTLSEQQTI